MERIRPGVHACVMNSVPGAADAGERLKRTALRNFGPDSDDEAGGTSYGMTLTPTTCPCLSLVQYALSLMGSKAYGPDEKVAWWVNFSYRGKPCVLAHEKFGLRLYLRTEAPEELALENHTSDGPGSASVPQPHCVGVGRGNGLVWPDSKTAAGRSGGSPSSTVFRSMLPASFMILIGT